MKTIEEYVVKRITDLENELDKLMQTINYMDAEICKRDKVIGIIANSSEAQTSNYDGSKYIYISGVFGDEVPMVAEMLGLKWEEEENERVD